MLKTILRLPDREISSGSSGDAAVKSCTLMQCVNSGEELTIGSVCAASMEITLITPKGDFSPDAGTQVTVLKQQGDKTQIPVGVFTLEKPTRPSANTLKLTGYDNITKLDKDLTDWLKELNTAEEWDYTLAQFAEVVCTACGLTFAGGIETNADFKVPRFIRSSVTGRQLMQWIGEICARFCRATPKGEIEFAWYTSSDVTIGPADKRYYFQKGLSYEAYEVAPVDAVQLRLADSDNGGALWPAADSAANPYIISGNPILLANVTEALKTTLDNICGILQKSVYTPCKVSIPACLDIGAGHTVQIVDTYGHEITAYVMTKTAKGQKDTLECTGSRKRDSTAAFNSATSAAERAAATYYDNMPWEQAFNKFTDNGKLQGIYAQDGRWFVNAEAVQIVNLTITGGIEVKDANGNGLLVAGGNAVQIAGWNADSNSLYSGNSFAQANSFFCTGSSVAFTIGDFGSIGSLVLKAGSNFGVTTDGTLYAKNAHIAGTIDAATGSIGKWNIGYQVVSYGTTEGTKTYEGNAIYSKQYDGETGVENTVILFPEIVCVQRRADSGTDVSEVIVTWREIADAAYAYAHS